jgi:hypothetical protein
VLVAITWSNVTDLAAELTTVSVGLQNLILAQVNDEVSDAVWGTRADRARIWLAAHLATLAQRKGGSSGPVTSVRVGEVAKTFATGKTDPGAFDSTSYGAEYERQLMQLPGARWTVSDGC